MTDPAAPPRRPRWRKPEVREILLGIALFAAFVACLRMAVLRRGYLARAADHEARRDRIVASPETIAYWEARWSDQFARFPSKPVAFAAGPPYVPSVVAFHERMRAKWARAADRPWIPVSPDPNP